MGIKAKRLSSTFVTVTIGAVVFEIGFLSLQRVLDRTQSTLVLRVNTEFVLEFSMWFAV